MTEIWEVEVRVCVEADAAEEAQAKAERFIVQLDEGEIWSSEVGIALRNAHETVEYRKTHRDIPNDITSYGAID